MADKIFDILCDLSEEILNISKKLIEQKGYDGLSDTKALVNTKHTLIKSLLHRKMPKEKEIRFNKEIPKDFNIENVNKELENVDNYGFNKALSDVHKEIDKI